MLTLIDIKKDFSFRISRCLFMDSVREVERQMFGLFTAEEITALTKDKRKQLEIAASTRCGKSFCFDRPTYDGVFQNRAKYEGLILVNQKVISLGLFKTAEEAHKAVLNANIVEIEEKKDYEPDLRRDAYYESCKKSNLHNHDIWSK